MKSISENLECYQSIEMKPDSNTSYVMKSKAAPYGNELQSYRGRDCLL